MILQTIAFCFVLFSGWITCATYNFPFFFCRLMCMFFLAFCFWYFYFWIFTGFNISLGWEWDGISVRHLWIFFWVRNIFECLSCYCCYYWLKIWQWSKRFHSAFRWKSSLLNMSFLFFSRYAKRFWLSFLFISCYFQY